MSQTDSDKRPFSQHRFLGRLNLHAGPPPNQFILYNHVTDYYYYGRGGHSFLPMRATLVTYLCDELKYEIVAIYSASAGLSYADPAMEQVHRGIVLSPLKESPYLNGDERQPDAADHSGLQPVRQLPKRRPQTRGQDFADLGNLLRQPNVPTGQTRRVAVIIERMQNLISNRPTAEDRPILDEIQSWTTLTNNNVSILVADVAGLDELPAALAGVHRSGVVQLNIGLPTYYEINQLFISAESGSLSREFGRSKSRIPPVKIQPGQRRDLIGRLDGCDALTIRSYFNECTRLEEPELNMRTLRLITSHTPDVWPTLLDETNLKPVKDQLRLRVRGQEHALDEIFKKLRDVGEELKAQLFSGRVEEKLLTYFFFAGPTGVGKTEVFRALSDVFSQVRSRKFNMPEYKEEHSVSRFFGAPPGYIGHGRGELGAFLLENPAALVLFDEFEKAHPNVWKNFLTMLEGSLTTGDGIRVDLSQAIFIFTSNAGTADLQPIQPEPLMTLGQQGNIRNQNQEMIKRALRQAGAQQELIGRLVSSIVSFNHMTEPVIKEIIQLKLQELKKELNQLGITDVHPSVAAFLHDEYVRQGPLGARIIVHSIDALRADIRALPPPVGIIYKDAERVLKSTDSEAKITSAYQSHEQAVPTARSHPARLDSTDDRTLHRSVMPSVVAIMIFDEGGRFIGHCTGFFISDSGHLVTRHQSIAGYTRLSAVYGENQSRTDLTLVEVDRYFDLAILQPSQPLMEPVPFLSLANSGVVEDSVEVVAFGIPTLDYDPVTQQVNVVLPESGEKGYIEGRQNQDSLFLLSTMKLTPELSGSPLIQREDGKLVGMILRRRTGGNSGYALVSSVLQAYLREVGVIQNINRFGKK